LKQLDSIENTCSTIANQGCTSKAILQALNHLGSSLLWFFHHPVLSFRVEYVHLRGCRRSGYAASERCAL